jgi:hypothetical protein
VPISVLHPTAEDARRTNLETTVEPSPGTSVDDIAELFTGEVEQLIEVNAAVCELSEGSLLLDLCSNVFVSISFFTPKRFPCVSVGRRFLSIENHAGRCK